jgi:hypothetical protein
MEALRVPRWTHSQRTGAGVCAGAWVAIAAEQSDHYAADQGQPDPPEVVAPSRMPPCTPAGAGRWRGAELAVLTDDPQQPKLKTLQFASGGPFAANGNSECFELQRSTGVPLTARHG